LAHRHVAGAGEPDGRARRLYRLSQESYAISHHALDEDTTFQEETRNAARALVAAVTLARAGKYQRPDEELGDPVKK
jgi:hypothetical protein